MEQMRKSGLWTRTVRMILAATWPLFVGALVFIVIAFWKILSIATAMREAESGVKESRFLGLHLYTVTVERNVRTLTSHWGMAILLLICLLGSLCMKFCWQRFRRARR